VQTLHSLGRPRWFEGRILQQTVHISLQVIQSVGCCILVNRYPISRSPNIEPWLTRTCIQNYGPFQYLHLGGTEPTGTGLYTHKVLLIGRGKFENECPPLRRLGDFLEGGLAGEDDQILVV